ncbi:MAG: hypothetical protein HY582_00990 [Candidatus Omnitrophica bacterium]|nr:hypothetical protein [Candidatus Omnitrophota bacterium]
MLSFWSNAWAESKTQASDTSQATHRRESLQKDRGLTLVRGEILRFYEERSGAWTSRLLIKDVSGKDHEIFVDPMQTLVKRGPQIEDLGILTGGMRVTILVRGTQNHPQASLVQIDGGFYG